MNTPERRKTPLTKKEIAVIVADREKHPEMTAMEWCKQYPISYGTYNTLKAKLKKSKPAKKPVRPAGSKNRKGKTPVLTHGHAELMIAMKEEARWKAEVDRLFLGLMPEGARALLMQLANA